MNSRSRMTVALGVAALFALFVSNASAKRLLICSDGTNNDSHDAVERYNESGLREDNSISNVVKLHLLAGGTLDNKTTDPNQHSAR